jgi:hypothetical protein
MYWKMSATMSRTMKGVMDPMSEGENHTVTDHAIMTNHIERFCEANGNNMYPSLIVVFVV